MGVSSLRTYLTLHRALVDGAHPNRRPGSLAVSRDVLRDLIDSAGAAERLLRADESAYSREDHWHGTPHPPEASRAREELRARLDELRAHYAAVTVERGG